MIVGVLTLVVALYSVHAEAVRVVVLGGSGYLGAHVCRALSRRGCSVKSISRNGDATPGGARFDGTATLSLFDIIQYYSAGFRVWGLLFDLGLGMPT